MRTIHTVGEKDHLERLVRVRPIAGLAELIWNAVDADATEVEFEEDFSGGLVAISVIDNGTGIGELDADSGFGHLGGSWKRTGNGLARRDKRNLTGRTARAVSQLLPTRGRALLRRIEQISE